MVFNGLFSPCMSWCWVTFTLSHVCFGPVGELYLYSVRLLCTHQTKRTAPRGKSTQGQFRGLKPVEVKVNVSTFSTVSAPMRAHKHVSTITHQQTDPSLRPPDKPQTYQRLLNVLRVAHKICSFVMKTNT